jgi:hypothetical protein
MFWLGDVMLLQAGGHYSLKRKNENRRAEKESEENEKLKIEHHED